MSEEFKISEVKSIQEKLQKASENNNLEELKECIEELDKSESIDTETKKRLV